MTLTSVKFLTLFVKAQTPSSAEHAQVVDFLRTRQKTAVESRATLPPRPAKRIAPEEPGPPLLTNIAKHGELPYYISTIRPMPKEAFKGERKIPSLCTSAVGVPFLRMKKPQPDMLSKIVGIKSRGWEKKIQLLKEMEDDMVPNAALEDQWDDLVEAQMKAESVSTTEDSSATDTSTYSSWMQVGRLGLRWQVEMTWQDWVARGEALQRIIEEEKALAAQEKGEVTHTPNHRVRAAGSQRLGKLEVRNPPRLPTSMALVAKKQRMNNDATPPADDEKDPFLSPLWAGLVEQEQRQSSKWTKKFIKGPYEGLAQRGP